MSETETMTLTEFLLARIAEDEERARNALSPGKPYFQVQGWAWYDEDFGGFHLFDDDWWEDDSTLAGSPARVLAECAAKRRVLYLSDAVDGEVRNLAGTGVGDFAGVRRSAVDVVLRALASVYADHAGFRQEWA